jgi:hypothetical protein
VSSSFKFLHGAASLAQSFPDRAGATCTSLSSYARVDDFDKRNVLHVDIGFVDIKAMRLRAAGEHNPVQPSVTSFQ